MKESLDTQRVHPQNKNSPFLLQKCFDTAQNWWIFRKQMLSSWIHYRHWYCKYPKQMVVPLILQIVHLKFKFNNSVNLVSAFTFSHKSGRWDKLHVANGPTQSPLYRDVAQWKISMKNIYDLDWILSSWQYWKKKLGRGRFFHVFRGKKNWNFLRNNCGVRTNKLPEMKVRKL